MSLVGFRAKNHPQQVAKRGADDDTDYRSTPSVIYAPLHRSFDFTVDAAANWYNAKCEKYFCLERSGLLASWAGERVWCNPPWSACLAWAEKAFYETTCGSCPLAVLCMPAGRTEQVWWQSFVEPHRDHRGPIRTRHLPGRYRFDWPPGRIVKEGGDRPPSGIVIVSFSRDPVQIPEIPRQR